MPLKIIIACGGTGGHLFPGIAVAQAAKARGHEVLVLISEKQIDALASKGHDDLKFATLPAIAMPSVFSLAILKFLYRFWKASRECRRLIKSNGAHAVLGMGGFTSLAPLYAGRRSRLKTLLHESNAIPGKANRLSAKFCDLILLGLAECEKFFLPGKTRVVGTPLRESLKRNIAPEEAWRFFDLDPARKVILVMGGSQGARGVNESVLGALANLDPNSVQLIHLTGPQELGVVQRAYAESGFRAYVAPFCQRMELAYTVASLCISRAGASSLTEISAFGLPSILIPYPHAADDHQTKNANVFVQAQAAVMIQERDLSSARLASLINDLLQNEPVRSSLSKNMRARSHQNSAELVCDAIERLCAAGA